MRGWDVVKQNCEKGARERHIQNWICSGHRPVWIHPTIIIICHVVIHFGVSLNHQIGYIQSNHPECIQPVRIYPRVIPVPILIYPAVFPEDTSSQLGYILGLFLCQFWYIFTEDTSTQPESGYIQILQFSYTNQDISCSFTWYIRDRIPCIFSL
jgi:hypothetical protein